MRLTAVLIVIVILEGLIISCGDNKSGNDEPVYEVEVGKIEEIESSDTEGSPREDDLDVLRGAVEAEPDSPDAHFIYMIGLRRAGEYEEALDECRLIGNLEGDNPFVSAAYLNFGTIVLDDMPKDADNRDELVSEAMDLLWKALGIEPESIPAHRVFGLLALEAGDNDKAIHHLSIALTAAEIGWNARMRMAEIFIRREDYYKAREHLEVALDLAEEGEDTNAVVAINKLLGSLPDLN